MAKPYRYSLRSPVFTPLIATAVNQVCTLNADLSPIPRHKFVTLRTPVGEFLLLDFEHRMTLVNEVSVKLLGRR